jgi:hypothetical protein
MTDQEVIDALQDALNQITTRSSERVIQLACQAKLTGLGIIWTRPMLPNPFAGGHGQVDLYIPGCDRPLLVELKKDGDWRKAAEVSMQLPICAKWLTAQGSLTGPITKLAVFGTSLQYPDLGHQLDTYDIRYIVSPVTY